MKVRYLMISLLLIVGWIKPLTAQQDLLVGVRPMGFAAFTAIADDANAVVWNPAGLTQLRQQELTSMRTNLFGSGFIQNHLGYVLPISSQLALGADWTHIGFSDKELNYSEHRVHIASAYSPFFASWISGGFNIKYQFSSTQLDNFSAGETDRVDGDIGVLIRPPVGMQLAFVLRDVLDRGISHEYQNQTSDEAISVRKAIVGLSYRTPLPNLTFSAETDVELNDRLRIGGEYQFRNLPAGVQAMLRAGLYKDWDTGERVSWALGGSLGVPASNYAKVLLEYAYLDSPQLSGTHRFALRIPFDFNPTAFSITDFRSEKLFASLYKRYASQPVVHVTLLNKQNQTIQPRISFAVEGYTPKEGIIPREFLFSIDSKFQRDLDSQSISADLREEFAKNNHRLADNATVSLEKEDNAAIPIERESGGWLITSGEEKYRIRQEYGKLNVLRDIPPLASKTKQQFSLPIVLSEKILNAPQGEVSITIEVTSPEELRFEPTRTTFPIFIYPKGKVPLTTTERVKPHVAFITHEDAYVTKFAQKIIEQYDEPDKINRILSPDKMSGVRRELSKFFQAIQIYESLRSYGVYYKRDKNEGYDVITKLVGGDEAYIDDVRYPREFLLPDDLDDLGGDCDDWSVLYASLLESLGIMTALVYVPGHVFVMFNTGVLPGNEQVIGLAKERYIIWNDSMDQTIWIPVDPPQKERGEQEIDDSFYAAWKLGLQQCQTHNIPQPSEGKYQIVMVRDTQKEDYPPAPSAPLEQPVVKLPNGDVLDQNLKETFAAFSREWEAYTGKNSPR